MYGDFFYVEEEEIANKKSKHKDKAPSNSTDDLVSYDDEPEEVDGTIGSQVIDDSDDDVESSAVTQLLG
ncbi:hypothetical protein SK128_000692, partial [Halocaridina rubra]